MTLIFAGMGWGLQAGAQKTYNAVFLQSEQAVKVFGDKAKVNFGGDFGISAGPVGRNLDVKGTVGTGMRHIALSLSFVGHVHMQLTGLGHGVL
jgi:lipid-binding SYLF domain-containing protein